jgi:RNA polymerase sigma-70 factor (ECF subfamily)
VSPSEREQLFKTWLEQHKAIVFRIARAQAVEAEDQADLCQEILLQLWLSIPRFQGKSSVSTWVYRVALNASLAWKRTEKKRHRSYQSLSGVIEIPDPSSDSQSTAQNNRMVERLYVEVRKLAPADRSLVLLYLDRLSYREMADILGISPDNVGVRLNRIKKRLCESLGGIADGP